MLSNSKLICRYTQAKLMNIDVNLIKRCSINSFLSFIFFPRLFWLVLSLCVNYVLNKFKWTSNFKIWFSFHPNCFCSMETTRRMYLIASFGSIAILACAEKFQLLCINPEIYWKQRDSSIQTWFKKESTLM